MKKRNIIVTDVDFVLLDWVYGLKPFLKDKGLPFDHLEKFKGSTYYPNLSELFFNDNESQNIELMNEFNNSEFVQHLPIFQNDSVKHLQNIHEKVEIYALTCFGDGKSEARKDFRLNNLKNHYGDIFKDVICVPVRTSKEPALRELQKTHNVLHYIDDRIPHLKEATDCKIDTLLYKRNEEHPETEHKIVGCWSEIESLTLAKNKIKMRKKMTP